MSPRKTCGRKIRTIKNTQNYQANSKKDTIYLGMPRNKVINSVNESSDEKSENKAFSLNYGTNEHTSWVMCYMTFCQQSTNIKRLCKKGK